MRNSIIPLSPIKRIISSVTKKQDLKISKEVVVFIKNIAESKIINLISELLEITKHSGRKTIRKEDLELFARIKKISLKPLVDEKIPKESIKNVCKVITSQTNMFLSGKLLESINGFIVNQVVEITQLAVKETIKNNRKTLEVQNVKTIITP